MKDGGVRRMGSSSGSSASLIGKHTTIVPRKRNP
jgi:hypothetical protein